MPTTRGTVPQPIKKPLDPQAQKGGYGYRPSSTPTDNPPSWLKNARMGGAQLGGPAWDDESGTQLRLMQENNSGMSAATAERVSARDDLAAPRTTFTLGGNTVQPRSGQAPAGTTEAPTWLRNIIGSGMNRQPAYGGQYDPSGQLVEPIVPFDSNPNPDITQGHLRGSNQPFVIGQDSVYYDPETGIATQGGYRFPLAAPSTPSEEFTLDDGGGFGTGGRGFRSGGRGGGYGGGGYSYDSTPGWLNNLMSLYSWQYKN